VLVWVDRAGVEALARVTRVLVRVGLAFTRLFCFAADLFAVDFRAVERALPLTFRCDAAAFNCFPLLGLWPRRNAGNQERRPGAPQRSVIVTGRANPSNPFFPHTSMVLDLATG
jgi:hypothetical protein